jgi:hypothetical protein
VHNERNGQGNGDEAQGKQQQPRGARGERAAGDEKKKKRKQLALGCTNKKKTIQAGLQSRF